MLLVIFKNRLELISNTVLLMPETDPHDHEICYALFCEKPLLEPHPLSPKAVNLTDGLDLPFSHFA
jgi:hypothetical protein